MSWESRQERQKRRISPYRMTREIWHQQIGLLVKTILYSASFLIGCALFAFTTDFWEIYHAGQVGYWMIAAFGVGTCLQSSLWRIFQLSCILAEDTRRQRLILERYRRSQGL